MASPNVIEFTDANFQNEVLECDLPVLVDFWATWCGPCKAIAPMIDEIADEYAGQVKVGKVETDKHQQTAANLRVTAVPTLFIFKNGQEVDRLVGAVQKGKLVERLASHM